MAPKTILLMLLVAGSGLAAATPKKPDATTACTTASTTSCQTICVDYVNECGQTYGGCFPDPTCTGGTVWPSFTKPPCSTTSTSAIPTSSPCPTICVDYVNECGMMYGGCFPEPACTGGTAWPSFPKPPCPTTISTASTASSSTPTVSPCPTICADYINECGQMYGGCFPDPACTGGTVWPTFTKPPCTGVNPTTILPSTPATSTRTPTTYDRSNIVKTVIVTVTRTEGCKCTKKHPGPLTHSYGH